MSLFDTPRQRLPDDAEDDSVYLSMEQSTSTQHARTRARSAPSSAGMLARLRERLTNLLLRARRRAPGVDPGDYAALEAERRAWEAERFKWADERSQLLEDCTAIRAEAQRLTAALEGWSALVRDAIFYGVVHGRAAHLKELVAEQLRASLAEIEGMTEVEVTELRLPTSSDFAPQLTLLKYNGPELAEWRLQWSPPPEMAGGAITLRGRKFGVSFKLVLTVSNVIIDGVLQCCCETDGAAAARVGCALPLESPPAAQPPPPHAFLCAQF